MKKFNHLLLVLITLLILPSFLFAQRTITGTVTDTEDGEPLIGVNILVQGTASGTVSDIDGTYSVNVIEDAKTIQFTYVGYQDAVLEIGASNILNLQMAPGEMLDEVIVIGYGEVKREDATGAIQSVGAEDFNKGAITSAQELLSGKIAGVNITSSGNPGGGAQIRIRGGSSLTALNDPLIVVDGVPIDNSAIGGSRNILNIVNPNDIANVTVLKDASATAIYGSRASNGVILITTKKGESGGKLSISYNGNVSIGQIAQTVDVLTADEFRTVVNEQYGESSDQANLLGDANTDWQSEIYQTAIASDHNVSLGGGVKGLPYRLSLGYTDKQGILKTDKFKRSSVALNLSPKFLENRLQFNINAKGSFIDNDFADNGAIGSAASFDPTQTVRDSESAYGGYFTWLQNNGSGYPITIATANPLSLLEQKDDRFKVNRYILSGSADYRFAFLPELRANLNLSYDKSSASGDVIVGEDAAFEFSSDPDKPGGIRRHFDGERTSELLEFYLNYTKELRNSKLDVTGGYSWQHFAEEEMNLNTNFIANDTTVNNSNASELYLLSLFGRLNYSIDNRYLFSFTLRRDASSRFSPEARWGLFPAGAFAWKVFDGREKGTLTDLKLRLGYGITGQQDIGNDYQYLSTFTGSEATAQYPLGGEYYTTLRPGSYDSNIKWEETTTYNVGLDFRFKNDRISGAIDYYQRFTKDLLLNADVPAGTNFSNTIDTNVGSLENKGLELSLNTIPLKKENISWELGGNFAVNENTITKLNLVEDPDYVGLRTGGISGGVGNEIQIHSINYPANSFYVYEQIYDDSGNPIEGEYVDRSGDGIINGEDLYHLEKPAPNVVLGLFTNVNYKKFSLSAGARSNIGNYVYNNIQSDFATYNRIYNSTDYLSNAHADVLEIGFENPQLFSDHFIQKASFFRIDHITLGYDLTDTSEKITNLRVYVTAQNPLLITQYSGLDPEISNGIDNNIYPRSRIFLFGVNATF